ncbi:MAG: SAM-dependent methyltransferase [Massilia sp.]|nr:SAM-dependent methyltransferase [Massilia sp.]
MPSNALQRNWFDQGGSAYARFRPEYPPELAEWLAGQASDRQLAIDVGCGNGQLTALLAPHFEHVSGFDPSADQIANAAPHANITYQRASAEHLPAPERSASLITAAQAAHWFDLPAFYAEVRRIAAPAAVLALISYGVLSLGPGLNELFRKFYDDDIGPFWPPERALVDSGYATIDFPFAEFAAPPMQIRLQWTLDELLGYVSTWSATRAVREAGKERMLTRFADQLGAAWGDPEQARTVTWPVSMRVGRL